MSESLPLEFMQLRVLIWKDEKSGYVGQCLETGSVVTADDFHSTRSLMFGTLTDEVDYNTGGPGSIRNLFDTPAPIEIWRRYRDLLSNRNADYVSGILMLDASY